ncbi:NADPH:quinone reductase [Granulicella pectinivorans]|jgi:NADPH:quinone reductase-like Zn-dependent oxidoreductase|uniref:NADPH:quinone reductase n=1 Tax=Granulicella pectinivorans TaxID=474950 RepID=A0A1I6LGL9_9BACT|nr:NADP-dependent oxidoreductase [Granulicella pectinivorans]SFS02470.1 NADPH:quinone reductase [Granulicella pectinivorans]
MKAAVLHEYGGPSKLQYEDFDDPVAGTGELLVRVAAASINPIDYKMRSGEARTRFPVEFPAILGRDFSGVVRTVGEGVTGFEGGERVMGLAWKTYAELVVVKASDTVRVPDTMELTTAAALPLVLLTGGQLIRLGTAIEQGQTVLVSGAVGGVGRAAVRTAKIAGAKVIAGVRKKQMDEAQEIGADQVIALDDDEAMAKVGFLDAVADTVGGKTAEALLGKVKQGGVFASVLGPPANAAMHPTVKVVPVMAKPDAGMLAELAEEVASGRLVIPIDRMLPLAEAGEGQAAAEKGGIGKVLLTV